MNVLRSVLRSVLRRWRMWQHAASGCRGGASVRGRRTLRGTSASALRLRSRSHGEGKLAGNN
eukprot:1183057-Prorocentrum_minimum.AAC.2